MSWPFPMMPKAFVAAILPALVALNVAAAAEPQTLELGGQAGFLGEWELSASVTEQSAGGRKEFSGPITMKHVGICSTDGPEERTGRIKLQMTGSPERIKATLVFDGRECTYNGALSATHVGRMECPATEGTPISLWQK
jgi:hypothetical protein